MNRSPSTLSYQLKELENDLNAVLFERYKKRLIITEAGKKLLSYTVTTFEALKELRGEISTPQGDVQGSILISCNLVLARMLVSILAEFREQHPKAQLLVRRKMPWEVVQDVDESIVDFGLTGLTTIPEDVVFEEFFTSAPVLVVKRDGKYSLPENFELEMLSDLPFVSFLSERNDTDGDPYFGANATLQKHIRENAVSVNSNLLMLQYVMKDVGVAVMDEISIETSFFGKDAFTLYPLGRWLPTVHYGLLFRKQKHLTSQDRAVIDVLRKKLKEGPVTGFRKSDVPEWCGCSRKRRAPDNRSEENEAAHVETRAVS